MRLSVADTEAVSDFLPVHLEDEAEPIGALDSLPGREVAHDPRGGGVLGVLQQEVPVDRILAGDRDKLVRKPDLNQKPFITE